MLTLFNRRTSIADGVMMAMLLTLASASSAQETARKPQDVPNPQQSLLLDEGVLVSTDGLAHVMTEEGLAAIHLADGKTVWTDPTARKPLARQGGVLLAQANSRQSGEMQIVGLDAGTGRLGFQNALPTAEGIRAMVRDGHGRSFKATAGFAGATAVIRWHAEQRPYRGIKPGVQARFGVPALDDGTIPATAARKSVQGIGPKVDQGVIRLDFGSGQALPVAKSASVDSAIFHDVFFQELTATETARRFLSADGRHVLSSEFQGGAYRWTILERHTERVLGRFVSPISARPFIVFGPQVLFTIPASSQFSGGVASPAPRSFKAIDLSTGKIAWSRALGNLEIQGPRPH